MSGAEHAYFVVCNILSFDLAAGVHYTSQLCAPRDHRFFKKCPNVRERLKVTLLQFLPVEGGGGGATYSSSSSSAYRRDRLLFFGFSLSMLR